MWDSLIAVGGTLAAVTAYTAAVADHRSAMWQFEDAKLTGKPAQVVAELEAVQHGTRSAITVPLTTVAILTPALADLAVEAAKATYAMRDSGALDVLETHRAVALAASDRFVAAAAELFADLGVAVS